MSALDFLGCQADFLENIWGDSFATFSMDMQAYQIYARDIGKLKDEVRIMLLAPENKIVDKMTLIDIVERLGISYHFQEEIEHQIIQIFNLINSTFEDYDLCTTSLLFRILRQHGYRISSDIFNKFVDENGKFKESLSTDIKGMLSLYEAAQVRTHADNILEEGQAFTRANLMENIQQYSNSSLMKQVNRALNQSLHRGVPRLEAYHYIMIYEEEEFKNEQILRLAKTDYNFLQMLHNHELSELFRWWKELKVSKLPYIRDRLVECYFWALTVYFEPQYSFNRIIFTKIIVLFSVLDDTYDAYGTLDELSLLTDSILRWEAGGIEAVRDYIKTCLSDILKIYDEVYDNLKEKGSTLGVHHLKETIKQYASSSNTEAKWILKGGELPPFAEYLKNALITSAYYALSVTSFLGMKFATQEVFDWIETSPKIVLASMEICRLANDVASYKIEKRRGNANGIDCYMKCYNVSEQEAMNKFEEMVEERWKEINEGLLQPIIVPTEILIRVLNLARAIDVIYKHQEDGYTEPQKVTKPHIIFVILDPIPL